MSWMAKLYDTYEQAMKLDIPDEVKPMPVSHTRQNANINIVIDIDGNFKRASVLTKTPVVLPATEQSASRTGKLPPPHPLGDKLHYIAKDYPDFGGEKPHFFESYRALLASWCDSAFTHPKAVAVLKYVDKGSVIKDLIEHKILFTRSGVLITPSSSEEIKEVTGTIPEVFKSIVKDGTTKKFDQGSALVCWTVEQDNEPLSDTWVDLELQRRWVAFDSSLDSAEGLCFVKGIIEPLASNHPSKILRSENGAKLISANDTDGFTFRGRFTDSKGSIKKSGYQALGVSFETTQKAHNALRWLLGRQGVENGKQAVIAWAVSGKSVPAPLVPTLDLDDFDEIINDSKDVLSTATDLTSDLGESFAKALNRYMAGYFDGRIAHLKEHESIIVMALDSATPGRMAITYYRDFMAKEYVTTIEKWHRHFAWSLQISKETQESGKKVHKETYWVISAPSPSKILKAAYGSIVDSNKELRKNLYERLLPCIADGRPIPRDIVDLAIQRASNRNIKRLKDQYSTPVSELNAWMNDLAVACSLYRGFHHPERQPDSNKRRNYIMSLDMQCASRDYLYGRLLAVAERIEEMAMIAASEPSRSTHASRLMQRFADRPASTWVNIREALVPYQQRLRAKLPPLEAAYNRLLDDISDAFDRDDFSLIKKLSGEYLLGYHCQRKWLREHKLEKGQWVSKSVEEPELTILEGEE
ncbi:type I-C CRISPR-associated protein Cas8c/Csd1 [Rheinheimera muenzenbergensis]|uniref:Type I-C CRISPR-associated protein Cas8c/Csd1 n=1 Tax=Rheinheimera muenzenbergensis TaxID=1193628 RepID=A0ABU8C3Q3_9GAMM